MLDFWNGSELIIYFYWSIQTDLCYFYEKKCQIWKQHSKHWGNSCVFLFLHYSIRFSKAFNGQENFSPGNALLKLDKEKLKWNKKRLAPRLSPCGCCRNCPQRHLSIIPRYSPASGQSCRPVTSFYFFVFDSFVFFSYLSAVSLPPLLLRFPLVLNSSVYGYSLDFH